MQDFIYWTYPLRCNVKVIFKHEKQIGYKLCSVRSCSSKSPFVFVFNITSHAPISVFIHQMFISIDINVYNKVNDEILLEKP